MGSQYSSKRESFHDAILKKDLKKVKYFIQNGLDVKNDLRALELATYRGSTDIVEYLLHRGCKPNNKRTARAFDIAVWKCHKEIAQLFLKAGIEYKGKNIYQETILFVAACSNNTTLTEILIESGCDMNETTRHWSPLHAAAARNHEQTLETLIKHGCSVDVPDKDGLTALAYCIRNENIKCIKLLLKVGCKIDMTIINSNECLRNQLIKYPLIEQLLYQELTCVKSLKELSRLRVRKCLDQRLISKSNQLPLPQKLKDYVAMREIFGYTPSNTSSSINREEVDQIDLIDNNNFQLVEINKTNFSSLLSTDTNEESLILSSSNTNNNKNINGISLNNNNNLIDNNNNNKYLKIYHSNTSSFSSSSSSSSSAMFSSFSPSKSTSCSSSGMDKEFDKNNKNDSLINKKTSLFKQATKKFGLDKVMFKNEI